MKLLRQTGYYFMGFSSLLLLVGGIGTFYGLVYMFDHDMDNDLHHTRDVLNRELSKRETLPTVIEIMDELVDIKEVSSLSDIEIYKDTLREVRNKSEMEIYRQYIYTDKINGKNYRISLTHSKFGKDKLLLLITALVMSFLVFFFFLLNLFSQFISRKLLQPFYHAIDQIQIFKISQSNKINLLPTPIDEFKVLNYELESMTEKLQSDYRSLKQFTENAAHETQTPLAIIQSQIELLKQRSFDTMTIKHLHQIQLSTTKISKLNKSLLLLTQIENRQFALKEEIALDQIINQKLEGLELIIEERSIVVEKELTPTLITANPILVDVIISNLISNATKHNIENGKINIHLDSNYLQISNLGKPPTKPTKKLFERFQKSDNAGKSVGLGLAIVKEICNVYNWSVDYQYANKWHKINIKFQT